METEKQSKKFVQKLEANGQVKPRKRGEPCSVENCKSKVIARSVCTAHGAMGLCLFEGKFKIF